MSNNGRSELMSLWAIQESLLQKYRGIFITAESIVVSVSAAIVTSESTSATFLAILGFALLFVWKRVTSNRAIDVSFVQWMVAQAERGIPVIQPMLLLKDFQNGELITIGHKSVIRPNVPVKTGAVNDEPFVDSGVSASRNWMEIWLPMFFVVLLIFVLVRANWDFLVLTVCSYCAAPT